ncbi:hypothetical protein RD149_23170, partial [Gordonia westfalica]
MDGAIWAAVSRKAAQIGSTGVFATMSGDELHDQRCGRSISAAKKADACFKMVFARRSSRFSRSSCAIRSASLVVVPG